MTSRTKKLLAIAALVTLPVAAWAANSLCSSSACSPGDTCCPAPCCPGPCCDAP